MFMRHEMQKAVQQIVHTLAQQQWPIPHESALEIISSSSNHFVTVALIT
jgi:hypothetical protein